jgi:hypothetical protein
MTQNAIQEVRKVYPMFMMQGLGSSQVRVLENTWEPPEVVFVPMSGPPA